MFDIKTKDLGFATQFNSLSGPSSLWYKRSHLPFYPISVSSRPALFFSLNHTENIFNSFSLLLLHFPFLLMPLALLFIVSLISICKDSQEHPHNFITKKASRNSPSFIPLT